MGASTRTGARRHRHRTRHWAAERGHARIICMCAHSCAAACMSAYTTTLRTQMLSPMLMTLANANTASRPAVVSQRCRYRCHLHRRARRLRARAHAPAQERLYARACRAYMRARSDAPHLEAAHARTRSSILYSPLLSPSMSPCRACAALRAGGTGRVRSRERAPSD
eukprot:IDg20915t1